MVSTRKRVPTAAAPTALSSVVGPSYHAAAAAAEVDSSHFETEPSHCPAAVGEASLNAGHASSRRQTAEKAVSVVVAHEHSAEMPCRSVEIAFPLAAAAADLETPQAETAYQVPDVLTSRPEFVVKENAAS